MSKNAPFKGNANAAGATPGPSFEEHFHKVFFSGKYNSILASDLTHEP